MPCSAEDINRLTKELAETNRFLRTLLDSLPVGVARIDTDRQIVYTNPAAVRILQLPKSAIEGQLYDSPGWQLIREVDLKPARPDEYATTRAFKQKETVLNHHTGLKNEDGSITWLAVSAVPILDRHGVFHGIVASFADITNRKRSDLALKKTEERYRNTLDIIASAISRAGMIEDIVAAENQKKTDRLTTREREVLRLIGQGKINGEIAEKLEVSEVTVRRHIGNINAKLKARNRAQLVLIALRARITHL